MSLSESRGRALSPYSRFTCRRRTRRRLRREAFTLVELLVVIGIIAALIGILLPVLSSVSARGRDLKCQSNIRQVLQAFQGYAAENRGSMPYGIYYIPERPNDFGPAGSGFASWASQVGKYVVKGADGDNFSNNFPPVLQCPEAQQAYIHIVGYVANMVVFPSRADEYSILGNTNIIRPALLNQLFPHNALIWDTAVSPGLENNVGYLVGADLDDVQRFWRGANTAQYRYFDPADIYARIPPGTYGNNRPVQFNGAWRNIDPASNVNNNGPGYPYQGNLRFRHAKNTAVNVGFADGHVEAIKGKFNPDRSMRSHDAIRKLWMMRWPSGIPRNPNVP